MSTSSSSASDEGSHLSQSDMSDQDWTTTLDQTLEQSSQPDDLGGDQEDIVCVALPPSLSTASVNEVALTGSTALDVLDQVLYNLGPFCLLCTYSPVQLLANDKIGKERAARLRRKYNSLRDNLETYVTHTHTHTHTHTLLHTPHTHAPLTRAHTRKHRRVIN